MKNLIIKIIGIALLLLSTSCSKESCSYVTNCVENEPEGYMVTTQSSNTYSSVGKIYKTTYNSNAPVGGDWNDSSLGANQIQSIQPAMWTYTDIGLVFGIALDNSKGVYLSATNVYEHLWPFVALSTYGPAGSAGIYYTDISTPTSTNTTIPLVKTGSTSTPNTVGTAFIPNSGIGTGNSIGNIAYDKTNNQLFATNLEDGRIYRIDTTTGIVKSIFDPFVIDNAIDGLAPQGEQLWGIGVLNEAGKTYVYFARTVTFLPLVNWASNPGTKEIWSIELDSNGEFLATEVGATKLFNDTPSSSKKEVPNVLGTQAIVSDIAFSCSGRMLLAEKGHPHESLVLEYVKSGATWIPGNNFYVGNYAAGDNSAGGVDYGSRENLGSFTPDDIVWSTGNYLNAAPNIMYGVQGMSASGNSPLLLPNSTTDLFIDYNSVYGTSDKGGHGDVEIFDSSCPCNKK
ncbi:hypothetical protein [Flavobacterium sp.]|uniref:hypothetical protein n=1 Tax=Flavobacterium sp. TaxID=239 RepID=UPI003750997C